MFGWLRKKDWKNSAPHLLLLSKFRHSDSPDHYERAEYWESVLKESPQKAIQRFVKARMLEPAELLELVGFKFKVAELKNMLKERQLQVSGRKAALIGRLIENDREGMIGATKGLKVLKCSEEGEKLADHYLNQEKEKRENAEKEVLNLLGKRLFSRAAEVVADFEASQVFPRGLGIDWSSYGGESDVEDLNAIFGRTPGILKGIDEDRLERLRLAAAIMHLWGTNRASPWLPDDFKTGIHLQRDTAARMLVFHASHLRNMKQYKEVGAKTVEVLGVDDANTCPACKKITGKKYRINKVPEFPNPDCTCEIGCRCTTVAGDF